MHRAFLICIALLLAAPAISRAEQMTLPPDGFPGQRATTDPLVLHEVAAARDFARARNVIDCETVAVYTIDGDESWGGNCGIYLAADLRFKGPAGRMACAVTFHEIMHALGVGHSPGGLMDERGPQTIPFECRKLVPATRAHVVVKRTRNGVSGHGTG